MVRKIPATDDDGLRATARRRWIWLGAACLVIAGLLLALKARQLPSRGKVRLGAIPVHTLHLANRSADAWMVRVSTGAHQASMLLQPHTRGRFELEHPGNGAVEATAQRVITEGEGCVERVIEWTPVAGEQLSVLLDEQGLETRSTGRSPYREDHAGIAVRSQAASPVLVFYGDLAAFGSAGNHDAEGRVVPEWIGSFGGIGVQVVGTGLRPTGKAARLRYRITALAEPAVASITPTSDSSHELVLEADGRLRVGSPSLRTLAGL